MTSAKINPSVRAEVLRLLGAVPRGLSAGGMARIGRMSPQDVETALAEMEAAASRRECQGGEPTVAALTGA